MQAEEQLSSSTSRKESCEVVHNAKMMVCFDLTSSKDREVHNTLVGEFGRFDHLIADFATRAVSLRIVPARLDNFPLHNQ